MILLNHEEAPLLVFVEKKRKRKRMDIVNKTTFLKGQTRNWKTVGNLGVPTNNLRLHYYHSCGFYVAHHSPYSPKTAKHTFILGTRTCTFGQTYHVFAGSGQRSSHSLNHFPQYFFSIPIVPLQHTSPIPSLPAQSVSTARTSPSPSMTNKQFQPLFPTRARAAITKKDV